MEANVRVDKGRLEEIMRLRGLNNLELAAKWGKHPNSVIRLKAEQSTTVDGLAALCKALDCHPFDILVAEGFPPPFSVALASH
jgi:Predicted transcriptional regulator